MNRKDIFKIWAPSGVKWSNWVRPVPFMEINEHLKTYEYCDFSIDEIECDQSMIDGKTAIMLDLPGYEGVKEGIAFARKGFRPIPLYNGTNEQEGSKPTVNNQALEIALIWGALELQKLKIDEEASPVFLLDSNRLNRYKMDISLFDNSWDLYEQDVPSAKYFLENGINKIVIRSESVKRDLKEILYKYQKAGINIIFWERFEEPKEIAIKKTWFKKEYKDIQNFSKK